MGIKIEFAVLMLAFFLADPARAGLLVTDGADPLDPSHAEVELNWTYTIDKERRGSETAKCHSLDGDVTVTAGVVNGADISVALPYTFFAREKVNGGVSSRVDGFHDLTVDVKYRIYDGKGLKLAVKPGLIISTGKEDEGLSDGRTGFAARLLATTAFVDGRVVVHANGGYERHDYEARDVADSSRADIFTFSLATEVAAAEGVTLAADFGLATNTDTGSSTPIAYALCGGQYEFSRNLQAHVGIKAGLTRPEDDFTGLLGLKVGF